MAETIRGSKSGRRRLLDPSARAIGIVSFTVTALGACTPPAPPRDNVAATDNRSSAPTANAVAPARPQGTVAERLQTIMVEHLGVPAERLVDTATIDGDLGDSLDKMELMMAVEEAFGIEIPDDEAERLITVGDLRAYVERIAIR